MAIETFYLFRLKCDICGKQTDVKPANELLQGAEADGWRMNSYKQVPGYTYHALTCSSEHEVAWEESYVGRASLYKKETVTLENWLTPIWSSRHYNSGSEALKVIDLQAPGWLD